MFLPAIFEIPPRLALISSFANLSQWFMTGDGSPQMAGRDTFSCIYVNKNDELKIDCMARLERPEHSKMFRNRLEVLPIGLETFRDGLETYGAANRAPAG